MLQIFLNTGSFIHSYYGSIQLKLECNISSAIFLGCGVMCYAKSLPMLWRTLELEAVCPFRAFINLCQAKCR